MVLGTCRRVRTTRVCTVRKWPADRDWVRRRRRRSRPPRDRRVRPPPRERDRDPCTPLIELPPIPPHPDTGLLPLLPVIHPQFPFDFNLIQLNIQLIYLIYS